MTIQEVKKLLASTKFESRRDTLLGYIFTVLALMKSGKTVEEAIVLVSKAADVTEWTVRDAITNRIWGKGTGKPYINRFADELRDNQITATIAQHLQLNDHDEDLFKQLLADNTIDLKNNRLFKISMGIFQKDKNYRGALDEFNKRNWIVLHEHTNQEKAGHIFENEVKTGDYFYVTLGGDKLQSIVRVVSDVCDYVPKELVNGREGWIFREVEEVKGPIQENVKALKGVTKFDFPSGNSTLFEIKPDRLQILNNELFEPYYGVKFVFNQGPNDPPTDMDTAATPNHEPPNHKIPLNQILYGPPGTGKTHRMQEIIKEWQLIKTFGAVNKNYEEFVVQYKWWELLSLVLSDLKKAKVPEIAKHPLVKAKLSLSSIKSVKARIWSTLQSHTVNTCPNVKFSKRHGELLFYKESDSTWRLDDSKEFERDFEVLLAEYEEFGSSDKSKTQKNFLFTTCHQSLSYEDFIEGIKPVLNEETAEEGEESDSVKYTIREGYFFIACQKAAQLAGYENLITCLDSSREDRERQFKLAVEQGKIFVLFLDEINRCNVSAVFGELITLIEDNKRLGAKNEIVDVFLPYSQKKFGVPGNLYIIGTMNTADRSVEALDAALRRRFSFTEMMPTYQIAGKELGQIGDIDLGRLLGTINERIVYLLDKDHQIGHSYFLDLGNDEKKLIEVFKNKIIPLLKEYFFNDYGRMRLVLGDAFIEKKEGRGPTMATNDADIIIEKTTYEFRNLDDNGLLAAIKAIVPNDKASDSNV